MELTGLTRNLSRVELAVSIVIIAIVIGYALNRIDALYAHTEMNGLKLVIRNMKMNTSLFVSGKIITNDLSSLAQTVDQNPVNLVIPPPRGYAGLLPSQQSIEKGRWYYDEKRRQLVYYVINDDYFESDAPGPASIRLSLSLNYTDKNNNGAYDSGADRVIGLSLVEAGDYEWKL